VEHWDLRTIEVRPRHPVILHSVRGQARSVALHLPAGEQLQDHQVHERAYLIVAEGEIELSSAGGSQSGGPGFLAHFEAQERHEVTAKSDARLVLLLAPWPGEGHSSQRAGGGAPG
jgi:quercetin dioxygenase-like cupin family protein